jgi:hypothetical protein
MRWYSEGINDNGDNIYFYLKKIKGIFCTIVEIDFLKLTKIYLRGLLLPTNIFPYTPTRERTQNQIIKRFKYLPLIFNTRIWDSFDFKMINLSITKCHKK